MIKKLSLTTILILAIYACLIHVFREGSYISQNQRQDNLIRAEHYIYNDQDSASTVIVGSSLSCRLNMDSLPGVRNVALNGMSIFDGLKIITSGSKKPDLVLIEMNLVFRQADNAFYGSLYNPFFLRAKRILPIFREGKQPLGFAGVALGLSIQKLFTEREFQPLSETVDARLYQSALAHAAAENMDTSHIAAVSRQLKLLQRIVADLQQSGSRVAFFEVPQHNMFYNYPLPRATRAAFFRGFPPSEYFYIMLPNWAEFQTSDGVHLGSQEANSYSGFLANAIKQINELRAPQLNEVK